MSMYDVARAMLAAGKGILAADESTGTCAKRFEGIGIECTAESRRQYRQMLIGTENLEEAISGIILYDETIRQSADDGRSFVEVLHSKGIIPGIKVDTGAYDLALNPGEKVTEGLDGLRARLAEYKKIGAGFAKWRAVITIGDNMPSLACYKANAHALARYAALCQEADIVPMVEPEILMSGDHSLEKCEEVTEKALQILFAELAEQGVKMKATILKVSMVISGDKNSHRANRQEVAEMTVKCLKANVPADLAGVVFLSGGQGDIEATEHLDKMNKLADNLPWPLSFSYGRAIQAPALNIWAGKNENVKNAQKALWHRAKMNGLASKGEWSEDLEK